jgi:hypothetical protein
MPGSLNTSSRRARGSWVPKLVGVGVIGVVAVGGVVYLGVTNHQHAPSQQPRGPSGHPTLSAKVIGQQTVGLINFGAFDDRDAFANDADDHPLMLQPTKTGLQFVVIPARLLATGQPQWTADLMADGSDIFIYNPLNKCLALASGGKRPALARCAAVLSQRWRPLVKATYFGQPFAAYANGQTGECLTAPTQPTKMNRPARPGVATLAACGPARTKSQEIAFWWTL